MERFKIMKQLGNGAFGLVNKAVNVKTGENVAVKKMKAKYLTWEECMNLREIKALRKLNHANIIKLKEVVKVNDVLYLIFEYIEQNLLQFYQNVKASNSTIPEQQIRSIIFQIASGLAHMNKNGFFHRDLKPENILIQRDTVKLIDFGLAREIRSRPPYTEYVSTRWYRSPELLTNSITYNSPIDIFALGCIMAELYLLGPLFAGNTEMEQLNKILAVMGTPSQAQWPEGYRFASQRGFSFQQYPPVPLSKIIPNACPDAIDLMAQMLRFEPFKRPSASQILHHPFFAGMSLPEERLPTPNLLRRKEGSTGKLDSEFDLDEFCDAKHVNNGNLKSNKPNISFYKEKKANGQEPEFEGDEDPLPARQSPKPLVSRRKSRDLIPKVLNPLPSSLANNPSNYITAHPELHILSSHKPSLLKSSAVDYPLLSHHRPQLGQIVLGSRFSSVDNNMKLAYMDRDDHDHFKIHLNNSRHLGLNSIREPLNSHRPNVVPAGNQLPEASRFETQPYQEKVDPGLKLPQLSKLTNRNAYYLQEKRHVRNNILN